MVFNVTFNNISGISWWPILLVEDTEYPEKTHRHATSHWQTLSHTEEKTLKRLGNCKTPSKIVKARSAEDVLFSMNCKKYIES